MAHTSDGPHQRIALHSGVTVEYMEQGSILDGNADATPVILIHGWPDSTSSYDLLRPLLSRRLRVFTVGLRGFGASDKPQGGYSVEQFAADVRSFLIAKTLRQVVVVGHSMGSIVAHALACKWPRLVSHLLLVDSCQSARDNAVLTALAAEINAPGFSLTPAYVYRFQASTIHNLSSTPWRFVKHSIVARSLEAPLRTWRAGLMAMRQYAPTAEDMSAITARTMILVGAHDKLFTREQCAVPLHRVLPSSRLLVLPGAYKRTAHQTHCNTHTARHVHTYTCTSRCWPQPRVGCATSGCSGARGAHAT